MAAKVTTVTVDQADMALLATNLENVRASLLDAITSLDAQVAAKKPVDLDGVKHVLTALQTLVVPVSFKTA